MTISGRYWVHACNDSLSDAAFNSLVGTSEHDMDGSENACPVFYECLQSHRDWTGYIGEVVHLWRWLYSVFLERVARSAALPRSFYCSKIINTYGYSAMNGSFLDVA